MNPEICKLDKSNETGPTRFQMYLIINYVGRYRIKSTNRSLSSTYLIKNMNSGRSIHYLFGQNSGTVVLSDYFNSEHKDLHQNKKIPENNSFEARYSFVSRSLCLMNVSRRNKYKIKGHTSRQRAGGQGRQGNGS